MTPGLGDDGMVEGAPEGIWKGRRHRGPWEHLVLGGLPVARAHPAEVVDWVFEALARGRGGWLLTANVDFIRRAVEELEVAELYKRADVILADGAPLVWAARLMGKPIPARSAGSDIVWSLAERAAREERSLFLLGGSDGAAAEAAQRLVARWPTLRLAGYSSPRVSLPPTPDELDAIRAAVVPAEPDLVYAAFGSPKQEFVIDAIRSDLPATWLMGCGISLSFIAGRVRRAPSWMQNVGLEWIHRMLQEPRRLTKRYLLDDLPFAARLLMEARIARGGSESTLRER